MAAATFVLAGVTGPVGAQAAEPSSAPQVPVIVRELPGSGERPEAAVQRLGGTVVRELAVIGGFSAEVPADRMAAVRAVPGVVSVTEDAELTLSDADADVAGQREQAGSLYTLTHQVTGASQLWAGGTTGQGIDVALVDSGIAPVTGLDVEGKVIHGPDLTAEAATANEHLDTYGHGTNMAGIIAGRDAAAGPTYAGDGSNFVGVAPDARIVSIKVADARGQTDVSQAIAAIDWVITHGRTDGLNIRVLNMSFGTDGVQRYQLDPLAYAAEQAWHAGIVVVVAAGNGGNDSMRLNNPATDPYLIAAGSADTNGTGTTADDVVSSFSSGGDGVRDPDVVAPGDHVVSLRDPGSFLDSQHPSARVGERFFRGSGTSQAAAVVSGAAALLLSQRPELSPDQVKALLTGTAQPLPGAPSRLQGAGLVDLAAAGVAPAPADAAQDWQRSTGRGSLEASRGSVHVTVQGRVLRGEVDVRGQAFHAARVAAGIREHTNWSGLRWSGLRWSGLRWSTVDYSGLRWSGLRWSGVDWNGLRWSGVEFSGLRWSTTGWAGARWL